MILRGRLLFHRPSDEEVPFHVQGGCSTSTVLVCLMVTVSLSIPQLLCSYSLTQWKVIDSRKISFGFATTSVISLWNCLSSGENVERWEIQCCQLPLVLQITSICSLLLFQKILVRYVWKRAWQGLVSAAHGPIPWKHNGLALPEGREGNHSVLLHAQTGASDSHFKFLYIHFSPRKWFWYYVQHMYGK